MAIFLPTVTNAAVIFQGGFGGDTQDWSNANFSTAIAITTLTDATFHVADLNDAILGTDTVTFAIYDITNNVQLDCEAPPQTKDEWGISSSTTEINTNFVGNECYIFAGRTYAIASNKSAPDLWFYTQGTQLYGTVNGDYGDPNAPNAQIATAITGIQDTFDQTALFVIFCLAFFLVLTVVIQFQRHD